MFDEKAYKEVEISLTKKCPPGQGTWRAHKATFDAAKTGNPRRDNERIREQEPDRFGRDR
jgi:hypothetical protein